MPGGRPTKYRPEMCEQAIEIFKQGASKTEVCCDLGITPQTFLNWQEEYPGFLEAVNVGVSLSQAWWEKNGRLATFNSEGFSASSYIFQMKNRFRNTNQLGENWSDRKETDISGSLDLSGKTDKELEARIAALTNASQETD